MPTALFVALVLAAAPFWEAKPSAEWTDAEVAQLLSDSPWATTADATAQPGRARGGEAIGIPIYLATAAPIIQADAERARRVKLRRKQEPSQEDQAMAEEYGLWLQDNRVKNIVVAIRAAPGPGFSDGKELDRMQEESVMRIGRKRIKMAGYFPPSSSDPYLRVAFPRQVQEGDKSINFELYIPGGKPPYRQAQFDLKNTLVNGKPEL